MMPRQLHRYCVLCNKEYGPDFTRCCTSDSLVAVQRSGFLHRQIRYFTLDGTELDDAALSAVRQRAVNTRDTAAHPPVVVSPPDSARDQHKNTQSASPDLCRDEPEEADRAKHRWRPVSLLFAVPAIGFVVSEALKASDKPGSDLLRTLASLAGVIGVALLVSIPLAGAIARRNRTVLLHVFAPGLHLTALFVVVLVVLHAAIAILTIYFGETALIGRIHVGLILAVVVGALSGASIIARNAFAAVQKAQTHVVGVSVSKSDSPRFWAHVEQLAREVGSVTPQNIVVGLDPNFFVTEADVVCRQGKIQGRTLYCSLPLSRIMSTAELSAVLGHELAHFKDRDTEFSERFYPIYRGTASSILSLQLAGARGGASAIPFLPAVAIFGFFLNCFTRAERRLSRDRELGADRTGADLTTPAIMATALVKVHAFSRFWQDIHNMATDALYLRKPIRNLSKAYGNLVNESANTAALQGLATAHTIHPTDSHPPLADRLVGLGRTVEAIGADALCLAPADAAITLISDSAKIEEALSSLYQAILARQVAMASPGAQIEARAYLRAYSGTSETTDLAGRKLTTVDGTLRVFARRDLESDMRTLPEGTEFEIRARSEADGREWIDIILPDGTSGHVLGASARSHTSGL